MDTIKFILAIAIFSLAIGLWAWSEDSANSYRGDLTRAKAYCDMSHNEINGVSEERCGEMLDKVNAEYLCNRTGEVCWVEIK